MARGSRNYTYNSYRKMERENENMKNDLIRAYELAKQQMLAELGQMQMNGLMDDDMNFTAHYEQIMAQIDAITEGLNQMTGDVLEELIPRQYALGQMNAVMGLQSAGVTATLPAGTFAIVDQNAVRSIVTDTFEDLARSNSTMNDFMKRTIRNLAKDAVMANVINGTPVKLSSEQLRDRMLAEGFKGYVKKNGAKIEVDEYAKLVLHTKTMQAHNDGTAIFMMQEGFDLVRISEHKTSCKTCGKYEGKIYSLSGTSKEYPAISSIPNGGPPFHPRCRHTYRPYISKFFDGSLEGNAEDFAPIEGVSIGASIVR